MTGADLPETEPDAQWRRAAADGWILLYRCSSCGRAWAQFSPGCPYCGQTRLVSEESRGTGRVYSWVTVARAMHGAFVDEVPYTVLTVTLDEGARLHGRLLGHAPVEPDMPVRAEFYRHGGERLIGFVPEK